MTKLNYTADMVATLKEAQPVDYAKATTLGKLLGKSPRSIIAKCKREGIAYIVKAAPDAKAPRVTKLDYVEAIAKALSMDAVELVGLEKSTARALSNLLMNIS